MKNIHKFKCKDDYFILDVNSGAIHVVDKIVYDIIDENNIESRDNVLNKFKGICDEAIINECYDEIEELIYNEQLYTKDIYENIAKKFEEEPNYIKAVCLNIAHDCNLRCKYCFADGEGYDQQKKLMSFEVAKKSIDFLIKNSGPRKNIEVDFFGGEPLLNIGVVKKTIDYARSLEKQYNKNFRFTITTNATLLTEEVMDYLEENMVNIVLSIDGRKKVQDSIRLKVDGSGTYDDILPKIKRMVERRYKSKKQYYIRGTFTSQNLDFSEEIKHFIELGFKEISVERPDIAANIELEFIGHLRDENRKLISYLGLNEFVRDYGYMEHKDSVKKLLGGDVLWMMIGKIPNADTISTSKLFEYFGTKKPILGCVPEGVASTALKEYNASFICEPDNIGEIKSKIIEIHNLFINKNLPVPNEEFITKHSRIFLTEQLITSFQFFLKAEL